MRHPDRLHYAHGKLFALGGSQKVYKLLTIHVCLVHENALGGEQ